MRTLLMQNKPMSCRLCISSIAACCLLTGCPATEQATASQATALLPASAPTHPPASPPAAASLPLAASIAKYTGPFGLGMAISETELASSLGFVKSAKAKHLFEGQPPKPADDFSDYYAITAPISGICKVGASRTITAVSGTGAQIKAAADRIALALEQQYGKPSLKKDKANTDIYTRRPQFWMVGLKEGSVSYGYLWASGKTERELPDNILNIIVFAQAKAINRGEVGVSYEFANYANCQKEWRKEKGSKS
ncbi:MAG: hypothetical protein WA071_26830 [Undibacterium umbellatum]|uniref:hypothetical protein n=1 Tax=Undibacterium umbellatum TaxID=2762300 RepID=UPI003BB6FC95